jgi:tetratricopeptide (TPR) repeat protein
MAKVSLRVYSREIEGMIEAGQLSEAIAHCQYILKSYPMHIETYQLLGKAFLESRRYADAADIFSRVLMAMPDSFVSHVGMSIIRDDEGKLDEAIWHMERAFEIQPSNPAIQGELRRLYGRRDGVEPPKIRLSRDALANMYAQGDLFVQAIAEIRAVLAEDNNRPDLQVMLARAYFRAGQNVEAAAMASTLLKKYSYCIDALRVLVDVLPGTGRKDDTQVYLKRLCMLDPYAAFSTGSAFGTDKVADNLVTLERLEYKQGAPYVASQASWAASLGISLVGDTNAEPSPDSKAGEASPQPAPKPSPFITELPAEDQTPVVGITTSIPEQPERAVPPETGEPDAEQPAEPTAEADIPDWLKAMAPKGVPGEAKVVFSPEGQEPSNSSENTSASDKFGLPDWLKSMTSQHGTEAGNAVSGPAGEPPVSESDKEGMPEWMQSNPPQQGTEEGKETSGPAPEPTPSASTIDDLPDWLKSMAPPEAVDAAKVVPETVPETTPVEPQEDAGAVEAESAQPRVPTPERSFTDWLTRVDIKGQSAKSAALDAATAANATAVGASASKVPASQGQKTPEGQAVTPPQPVLDAGPAVPLQNAMPPSSSLPPASRAVTPPGPDTEPPFQPTGEVRPLPIEDDTLAWLESLAVKQGAKEEELLTKPQDRKVELPDSVSQAAGQPLISPVELLSNKTDESPVLQQDIPVASQPAESPLEPSQAEPAPVEAPPSAIPPSEAGSLSDDEKDKTPVLLKGQMSGQSATPQEPPAQPAGEPVETPPEWLEHPGQEPEASVETPGPAKVESGGLKADNPLTESDITITSWLSKMDVEEALRKARASVTPEQPAEPAVSLPDWLKDLDRPVPQYENVEAPKEDGELPDWLRQSVQPGGQPEVELTPSADSSVEAPPTWIDEAAPVSQPVMPTAPDEWIPADGKPVQGQAVDAGLAAEQGLNAEPEPGSEQAPPVAMPTIKLARASGTGMLSNIPVQDKDGDLLMMAQLELEDNNLNEAMKKYMALIKKDRLLDEVIHDLREALYRFPVDIIVWQTLGDAYMRANRLQDALDAYTKAEELLR